VIDEILEEYENLTDKERLGKPLDNMRHEIFSVHVATGRNLQDSYRAAFGIPEDGPTGGRPSSLVKREDIRVRVGHLATQRAEMVINRSLLTEKNILDEYAWGVRNSRDQLKYKDHKGYLDSLSRIFGLFSESDSKNEMANKSIEELRQEVKMLETEFGSIGGIQKSPSKSGNLERDVTPEVGELSAISEADGIPPDRKH
tara:strand:+ start:511 stop:1110 length:600 start_codon:yes stop_codon:yes gene_type:complete